MDLTKYRTINEIRNADFATIKCYQSVQGANPQTKQCENILMSKAIKKKKKTHKIDLFWSADNLKGRHTKKSHESDFWISSFERNSLLTILPDGAFLSISEFTEWNNSRNETKSILNNRFSKKYQYSGPIRME